MTLIAWVLAETNTGAAAASVWAVLPIAAGAFALVMIGMAIGLFFGKRPISGSCGGIANVTNEQGETSCSLCQNPGEACKELQRRMEQGKESVPAQEPCTVE